MKTLDKDKLKTKITAQQKLSLFGRIRYFLLTPLWRPGVKDIYFFCVGLRSCITAGLPIISAFKVMSQSVRHRAIQKACVAVNKDLSAGLPIEKALRSHPKVFSPFFTNMVSSGLKSGSSVYAIDLLIKHFSWVLELRSVILQVVWYPVFLLFAGSCIMSARDIIIMNMQHKFAILKSIYVIVEYFTPPVLGMLAAFFVSRVLKHRRMKPFTDECLMRLPVIGNFYGKYSLATFFRLFATSVEAGQQFVVGLNSALNAMDNYYYKRRMRITEKFLRDGESITEAFYVAGVFSPMDLSMARAGEMSGSVPELLKKLADYYSDEVRILVPGFIKAFAPFLLFFVAIGYFVNVNYLGYGMFIMLVLFFLTI